MMHQCQKYNTPTHLIKIAVVELYLLHLSNVQYPLDEAAMKECEIVATMWDTYYIKGNDLN